MQGHEIYVELKPTQRNPWFGLECEGLFPIVRGIMVCANLVVTERGLVALAGQVQVAGRFALTNFAHVALLAEVLTSVSGGIGWVDALGSFYYGFLPGNVMTGASYFVPYIMNCNQPTAIIFSPSTLTS